ncbi:hypothetical protein BDF14DRAFT_1843806 [Spinellus fusiger]|nr:hypothetical protein BDF14DRAFT_1843806 [Spinellus fusiger]
MKTSLITALLSLAALAFAQEIPTTTTTTTTTTNTTSTVVITQPLPGASWRIGSSHNVTWQNPQNIVDALMIRLMRGDPDALEVVITLATDVDVSKGSAMVILPQNVTGGSNYSIAVGSNPSQTAYIGGLNITEDGSSASPVSASTSPVSASNSPVSSAAVTAATPADITGSSAAPSATPAVPSALSSSILAAPAKRQVNSSSGPAAPTPPTPPTSASANNIGSSIASVVSAATSAIAGVGSSATSVVGSIPTQTPTSAGIPGVFMNIPLLVASVPVVAVFFTL